MVEINMRLQINQSDPFRETFSLISIFQTLRIGDKIRGEESITWFK